MGSSFASHLIWFHFFVLIFHHHQDQIFWLSSFTGRHSSVIKGLQKVELDAVSHVWHPFYSLPCHGLTWNVASLEPSQHIDVLVLNNKRLLSSLAPVSEALRSNKPNQVSYEFGLEQSWSLGQPLSHRWKSGKEPPWKVISFWSGVSGKPLAMKIIPR